MIYPVILAGGNGTRLWPLSRKSYPKQFTSLKCGSSLFQQTLKRVHGTDFAPPMVMTHSDYRFTVSDQIAELDICNPTIMIEPEGRNTAPAILAAALKLCDTPDAIMLVLPTDHDIKNEEVFLDTILDGEDIAAAGKLVAFGVKPDRPETGYGYLELFDPVPETGLCVSQVKSFVEKPVLERAKYFLGSRHYLWNSGIYMFRVRELLEAYEVFCPQLIPPVRRAVEEGRKDLNFFRLSEKPYVAAENTSIDYAIMEACETLTTVSLNCGWSDMGSWASVWENGDSDNDGVVQNGNTTAIGCEKTLLRSENDAVELVGIGLKNIAAIA